MNKTPKYYNITERPGAKASKEEIERLYQRYCFAQKYCKEKKILEVACGTGIGLNFLASNSSSITGIDIDSKNLDIANQTINLFGKTNEIVLHNMDAHKLKFNNEHFDVIIIFEAIYYLENPELFISEAFRVLKSGGTLLIGSVNKDWNSFHSSPYAAKYFSIPDYEELLQSKFEDIRYFGGFHTKKDLKLFTFIKNIANKLNLIPRSLKAREFLKRLFIGKLVKVPNSISEKMATYYKPDEISEIEKNEDYKIIYVVAKK